MGILAVALFLVLADPSAQPLPALSPTPGDTSSPCIPYLGSGQGNPLTLPAPLLPAAFAARYPNGAAIWFEVKVNSSGHVLGVQSAANPGFSNAKLVARDVAGSLGNFVNSWARRGTFEPPMDACKPQAGTIKFREVFIPSTSGVMGKTPIVGGVNFNEMTYKPGPCSIQPAPMHLGAYEFDTSSGMAFDESVDQVYGGMLGGVPVAVVELECKPHGPGFAMDARLYAIEAGAPTFLGSLGTVDDYAGPDGEWIYVSFSGGLLYADTWAYDARCKRNDWTVSTYSIRGGKLAMLHRETHHRNLAERACYGG